MVFHLHGALLRVLSIVSRVLKGLNTSFFLGLNNSLFLKTLKKCLRGKTLDLEHILVYWAPLEMWHVVNIILAALISFIGYWIVWCRAVPLPRPGWGPPGGHGRAMGLQGTSPGLALRSAASQPLYLYWAQPRPDTGHCSDIIIRLTKIAYNVRFNMVKNELNRFWVYAFSFNIYRYHCVKC